MFVIGQIVALVAVLGICLFALVRGGVPERLTGATILSAIPLGFILHQAPESWVPVISLVVDGAFAFIFLILVLRYALTWLGAVMLLYAAQFALHAFYFVAEREPDRLHAMVNNGIFVALGISLLIGTLAHTRRRAAV